MAVIDDIIKIGSYVEVRIDGKPYKFTITSSDGYGGALLGHKKSEEYMASTPNGNSFFCIIGVDNSNLPNQDLTEDSDDESDVDFDYKKAYEELSERVHHLEMLDFELNERLDIVESCIDEIIQYNPSDGIDWPYIVSQMRALRTGVVQNDVSSVIEDTNDDVVDTTVKPAIHDFSSVQSTKSKNSKPKKASKSAQSNVVAPSNSGAVGIHPWAGGVWAPGLPSQRFVSKKAKDMAIMNAQNAQKAANALLAAKNLPNDVVRLGSLVTVDIDGETDVYLIVEPDQVNPMNNEISYDSPIGNAMLNHKRGEMVVANTPNGDLKIRIKSIDN